VIYRAEIGRAQVDFVVTGMGVENAYRITDAVMTEPYPILHYFRIRRFAKGSHAIGDVLAADAVQLIGSSENSDLQSEFGFRRASRRGR